MLVYNGQIDSNSEYIVYLVDDNNYSRLEKLDLALELKNHSPTGFCWGYGGSGPAQLALALLYNVTGDKDLSLELYQDFKRDVIARLDINTDWVIAKKEIEEYIKTKQ